MKHLYLKTAAVLATTIIAHFASAATVTVTGDDTMRFNVATIEAKAGEELTVVFKNEGNLPKQAMGHNFVILKPGTDLAAFGNAAVAAAANDYIPTDAAHAQQVVAHTKVLGPKESETLTVTFETPGTYPFICSFPGHWALMKGTITVK